MWDSEEIRTPSRGLRWNYQNLGGEIIHILCARRWQNHPLARRIQFASVRPRCSEVAMNFRIAALLVKLRDLIELILQANGCRDGPIRSRRTILSTTVPWIDSRKRRRQADVRVAIAAITHHTNFACDATSTRCRFLLISAPLEIEFDTKLNHSRIENIPKRND